MKKFSNHLEYITPMTEVIEMKMETVLCQSSYGATLENMSDSDYTFTF